MISCTRNFLLFFFLLGQSFFIWSCAKQQHDLLIVEVGDTKIFLQDYEKMLVKSNGGWEAAKKTSKEEKQKFLDLVIKYRLKVNEAYRRGLQHDPEVINDMQIYRNNLASVFFIDKELIAPGMRKLYERRKEEIRASHILIGLPPNPSPEDTLKAWEKATMLIKRLKEEENFANLAKLYSEDPSAKENGGDLYYFTAGNVVPQFEDACYSMKNGEISPIPVRTKYGYHIIKLSDRKPNPGQIRASHILIRFPSRTPSPEDTLKAWKDVSALQDSLRAGKDFAEIGKKYSQDLGSSEHGGDLGYFGRRRTVRSFEEVAFSLAVSQVSNIVRTPYGYHLIKVTDIKPIPSFEESKEELKQLYQEYRFVEEYQNLFSSLKAEYHFKLYPDTMDSLFAYADTTKTMGNENWVQLPSPELRKKPFFSITPGVVTFDSLVTTISSLQNFRNQIATKPNVKNVVESAIEQILIQAKTQHLEDLYPEFRAQLKEYEEGVLLYKLEQQEVWNKVTMNDSILHAYYELNKEKYVWPDRVNFSEIHLFDEKAANALYDSLKAGIDFGALAARHTERPTMNKKKGEWGLRPATENELTRAAFAMGVGKFSAPISYEGGYSLIKVITKEPARLKTFEEAHSEVSSQYHDMVVKQLENDWVESLRKNFPVKIINENLNFAFTRPYRQSSQGN